MQIEKQRSYNRHAVVAEEDEERKRHQKQKKGIAEEPSWKTKIRLPRRTATSSLRMHSFDSTRNYSKIQKKAPKASYPNKRQLKQAKGKPEISRARVEGKRRTRRPRSRGRTHTLPRPHRENAEERKAGTHVRTLFQPRKLLSNEPYCLRKGCDPTKDTHTTKEEPQSTRAVHASTEKRRMMPGLRSKEAASASV